MRLSRWAPVPPLVAAAAVFFAGGVVSAQGATGPNCGDTVNGNVSLSHDLICPSTDGLDVGSPSTTIHLNGHKITCVNDELPCGLDYGIYTEYNNTRIVGPGTITGFETGIGLFSSANVVSNLSHVATSNSRSSFGVLIGDGYSSNLVTKMSDTGSGTSVCSCSFGVANSLINDTSTGAEFGFAVFGDRYDQFQGNVATHAFDAGFIFGISDHTSVKGNKADHTIDGAGFVDECSTYSTYQNNTSNANGDDGYDILHSAFRCNVGLVPYSFPGDHFAGMQVTFTGNGAKGNGGDGAYFEKADAAEDPLAPGGSTITGNTFVNNSGDGSDSYRTYASQWAHNTSTGNGGSGYYFDNPAADMINGNTGNRNHEDGLTIYYDSTCEVSGPFGACDPQWVNYNTFAHNSEFGAFANDIVASIGNVAHDNGTAPVDCVNVNCVAHASAAATSALAAKAAPRHPERTAAPKLPAIPTHR